MVVVLLNFFVAELLVATRACIHEFVTDLPTSSSADGSRLSYERICDFKGYNPEVLSVKSACVFLQTNWLRHRTR
jgi:hypothetical protein